MLMDWMDMEIKPLWRMLMDSWDEALYHTFHLLLQLCWRAFFIFGSALFSLFVPFLLLPQFSFTLLWQSVHLYWSCYLCHRRWRMLCFHPFLFVCLCAGYLKKLWTDLDEIFGQVRCVTRTNWLDFGEDPDPDPTTRIFKVIRHHWEIGLNRYIAWCLKKLWTGSDETWWACWVRDEE